MKRIVARADTDVGFWLVMYVALPFMLYMAFFTNMRYGDLSVLEFTFFVIEPILLLGVTLQRLFRISENILDKREKLLYEETAESLAWRALGFTLLSMVTLIPIGLLVTEFPVVVSLLLFLFIFAFRVGLRIYYTAYPFLKKEFREMDIPTIDEAIAEAREEIRKRDEEEERKKNEGNKNQ